MKNLFYLSIVVCFFIMAGCGKTVKDKLTGLWKLKSMDDRNLSKDDLKNATITFKSDGKILATASTVMMDGTWDMSKDEKTINIKFVRNNEKENWNIQSLSDKELVYTVGDDKGKVTLER